MMKHRLFLLVLLVFVLLCGCAADWDVQAVDSTVDIGDYVFCVEEATGDRYNVRVSYSIKRRDGGDINPNIRFGLLTSDDGLRSAGGTIRYSLSDDKKTIWIVQEQSSSQKFDCDTVHTVVLEDLIFGEDSVTESVEGKWSATYKIQINDDYTELITDELKIQILDGNTEYLLSSVQLSTMGIHMEMEVPNNGKDDFIDHFDAYLIRQDGKCIELEFHHSIRRGKTHYHATAEAMFKEIIEKDDLYAIVICGQEILV